MNFLNAVLFNPLLQMALLAGFAASIAGGIVGSYVVVKRIVFIAGSISHAVLGGIGLSVWLAKVHGLTWLSPLEGALAAAIISALIIGWVHLRYRQREDSIIAAVWSIGMAVGILLVSQTPGGNLESFLVGNILWVTPADLTLLFILDALVLFLVLLLHKRFVALCFDPDHARLQGVSVGGLYMLLLLLISVSVVLLMEVVGVVLVLTMLALPAMLANLFAKRLSAMMGLAVASSLVFCMLGMAGAYYLNTPPSATIALLAGLGYALALWARRVSTALARR